MKKRRKKRGKKRRNDTGGGSKVLTEKCRSAGQSVDFLASLLLATSKEPRARRRFISYPAPSCLLYLLELELELIQTQMAQKPMLRAEVGMRVRCANKASAE